MNVSSVPGTLAVWAEPFVVLRLPQLYNLRMDPFERADVTTTRYRFLRALRPLAVGGTASALSRAQRARWAAEILARCASLIFRRFRGRMPSR